MRLSRVLILAVTLSACGPGNTPDGTRWYDLWPSSSAAAVVEAPHTGMPRGVDISHYDGDVDLNKAKSSGVAFAYIKATEGVTIVDPAFARDSKKALAQNLPWGAYHFYEPADDPKAQAALFVRTAGPFKGKLPPVLDIEVTRDVKDAQIASGVETWLKEVEAKGGCKPLVYSYGHFLEDHLGGDLGGYGLWLAAYEPKPYVPRGWDSWLIWQHSETGKVAGIRGDVDLNLFHGDAEALEAMRCP